MTKLTRAYLFISLLLVHQAGLAEVVYKFGVVPQFNAQITKQTWQPVLDAVSRIARVKLVLYPSTRIPQFEKQFGRGEFHFAYMNPYHAIVANRAQGYQPILHDRANRLYGIIVVRNDSPIKSIKELDGKKMAMPAPNALGAALIPRAEFATKFRIKPAISYVRSHDSVYLNTLLGTVEAGGGVMGTFKRQPQNIQDQLRILYKTGNVARHPITVHPSVPAEDVLKVRQAFLELAKTRDGPALLKKIPVIRIAPTSLDDYRELIDMQLDRFYIKN